MNLTCCFPLIYDRYKTKKRNLIEADNIDSNLLFLYSFLYEEGIDIRLYSKVRDNIITLCPDSACCNDNDENILNPNDLDITVRIVCNEQIISDSFVIY